MKRIDIWSGKPYRRFCWCYIWIKMIVLGNWSPSRLNHRKVLGRDRFLEKTEPKIEIWKLLRGVFLKLQALHLTLFLACVLYLCPVEPFQLNLRHLNACVVSHFLPQCHLFILTVMFLTLWRAQLHDWSFCGVVLLLFCISQDCLPYGFLSWGGVSVLLDSIFLITWLRPFVTAALNISLSWDGGFSR